MTNVKVFMMGALLGTLFGATFLSAISHFLVIGLAVVGAATAPLAIRRHRLPKARAHKDLKRANAEGADGGL
jgi:hypothetical protein